MQSLISFAFESGLQVVDLFEDESFLDSLGPIEHFEINQISAYRTIIARLTVLRCTGLNVLYFIAPFIEQANEEELGRLTRVVEYLANTHILPDIALTGQMLNAFIHRVSPGGPVSVVKALYKLYLKRMEIWRLLSYQIPLSDLPSYAIMGYLPWFLNPKD